MNCPADFRGLCTVLQPLFDIGDVRDLNMTTHRRLAALIHPRDAADLTIREVLALLSQIRAEIEGDIPPCNANTHPQEEPRA